MTRAARHIRVTGRVQGVFFRAWTRRQAEQLGVHGWVRNCSDGSVEAHLEGQERSVEQLIQLLRQGPSGAVVKDVDIADAEVEKADRFAIRH